MTEYAYEDSSTPNAVNALKEHYGISMRQYELWGSPLSMLVAAVFGMESRLSKIHPGQLHYARFDPQNLNLDEAIRQSTRFAYENLRLKDNPGYILDLGCGIGGIANQIAEKTFDKLIGITIVPEQVRLAERRRKIFGIERSRFVLGNYMHIPTLDNIAKGAIAIETICHIDPEHKFELFQEVYRVLEPGAIFVDLDGFLARMISSEFELYWYNKFRTGFTLPEMVTSEEFTQMAQNAGFKVLKSEDLSDVYRPSVELIYNRARNILIPLNKLHKRWSREQSGNILMHGLKQLLLSKLNQYAIGTAFSDAFADTLVAQYALVCMGLMQYHIHVLQKPE